MTEHEYLSPRKLPPLRLSSKMTGTVLGGNMSDTGLQKLAFLLLVTLILVVATTGGV